MTTTKAEQETIIQWDQEECILHLYTAYPAEAKKWVRLGYGVEVYGRTKAGQPRSWRARAPLEALRLRKLVDGQLAKRRRGHSFGLPARKLADSAHQSQSDRPRDSRRNKRRISTAD